MTAAPDLMTRIATLERERNEARATVARVEALAASARRLAGVTFMGSPFPAAVTLVDLRIALDGYPAPVNPECDAGKCLNCDGTALDEQADEIVQCEHGCHAFERRAEIEAREDRP